MVRFFDYLRNKNEPPVVITCCCCASCSMNLVLLYIMFSLRDGFWYPLGLDDPASSSNAYPVYRHS